MKSLVRTLKYSLGFGTVLFLLSLLLMQLFLATPRYLMEHIESPTYNTHIIGVRISTIHWLGNPKDPVYEQRYKVPYNGRPGDIDLDALMQTFQSVWEIEGRYEAPFEWVRMPYPNYVGQGMVDEILRIFGKDPGKWKSEMQWAWFKQDCLAAFLIGLCVGAPLGFIICWWGLMTRMAEGFGIWLDRTGQMAMDKGTDLSNAIDDKLDELNK